MSVISSPDTNRYVCAATHFLCVIIIVVIVVVVIVVVLVSLLILLWVIFVAVVQKEKNWENWRCHVVTAPKPRKSKVITMRCMLHFKARIKVGVEARGHHPVARVEAYEKTPRISLWCTG